MITIDRMKTGRRAYSLSLMIARLAAMILIFSLTASNVFAARIKEIGNFEGIRQNHLIGYGLITGLDGTGDKSGTEFTVQSLVNMLNRFGVKVDPNSVKVKNVAAVMVTAELSPFRRSGDRIDLVVSSIGDAKSLQGGTLLFTPLKGADGLVYAVAQGPVSVGGFIGGGDGAAVQKNHLTVGRVPEGGLVEKEIPLQFSDQIYLALRSHDFTTSNKVAQKINAELGADTAYAEDGSKVRLKMPSEFGGRVVEFLARVEGLDVAVDHVSKIVVNERTGTIVIGENVRISQVAVSHGSLSVEIKTRPLISQPQPLGRGETVVVPETQVTVEEQKARLIPIGEGTTLGELVKGLNAIGATPRDLISILQAIKAAGGLQADMEII